MGFLDGLGGAILGGAGSLYGGSQAKKAAAKNRRFQRDMSNTSYQRAMADMRKAGLNPMLAYQQGGAGTPGGATAQTPDYSKAGDQLTAGRAMSESKKTQKQQRLNLVAQALQVEELTRKARSDQNVNASTARKLDQDARSGKAAQDQTELNTELIRLGVPAALTQNRIDLSQFGRGAAWLERAGKSAGGFVPNLGLLLGGGRGRGKRWESAAPKPKAKTYKQKYGGK